MPVIRANRDSVDDRFSVLGFTINTEHPLFEVAVATDPGLFHTANRPRRTRHNFFSSRGGGALRARQGEAVYLVPPEVLSNFIGQPKLYFGLATYREDSHGVPVSVQNPTNGHMFVNIAGLTGRGLQRVSRRTPPNGANGHNLSLVWGGDALPQNAAPPASPAVPPAGADPAYDDGFGPLPTAPAGAATQPANRQPSATQAQAMAATDDDARGIEGPIPDYGGSAPAMQQARAFAINAPEYPQASRFEPASPHNYRAVAGQRTIDRIVIHITDGGPNIAGPISWFQNPQAQVSSHYVIGQDGEVVQMVAHNDIAWHARSANSRSIGIEHVANTRGLNPTAAQYCASAALVSWLCDQYNIPADRTHILGHSEADPRTTHTACPNSVWDWNYFMGMVTSRSCYEPPAQAQAWGEPPLVQAQEIITPFYDPADPMSALTCQNDAFSQAREEWFVGVQNTRIFPHSAICLLEMKDAGGNIVSRGTGFYIGPNRILTCAHNLHGQASVDIIPGNDDHTEHFGRSNVTSANWRVSNRYPADGSDYDLAVINNVPIAAPNNQWFGFLQQTPSEQMPVVVCGYSRASNRVPELTQAMNGRKQHLHAGYIRRVNGETVDYPLLTLKRASGSPVYHIRESNGQLEALVLAVHVSGAPAAAEGLNRGCFLTPAKIDWIEGRTATLGIALGDANGQGDGQSEQLYPVDPPAPKARSLGGVGAAATIAGVVIQQVVNNTGDVRWTLDQFRGIKHPNDRAPNPVPAFRDANTIRLTDWPKVENLTGDEISAGFSVDWQYNGISVGNLLISNIATNDALGQGLEVRAQIMDDNAVYPSQSNSSVHVAALRVRFTYRFTRTIGSDWIAVRDLHLFGDGTSEITGRWEQN